jgi:hypothetical protein
MDRPAHRTLGALLPVLLLFATTVHAQDRPNAVALQWNVVASSRIFTSPLSRDPVLRNTTTDIGVSYGWNISYARDLTAASSLQLSLEYNPGAMESTDHYRTQFEDGYRLYAGEALGVFRLPVSGETFVLFIGGGGGLYWGTRTFSIAGIASRSVSTRTSFGIVTTFGMEYHVFPALSLKGELRFRDPQVTTENVFDQPSVVSNGVSYPLETTPFSSRINGNGNIYALGVVFRW